MGKSAEAYKKASQRDVKITIDQENFLPLDRYFINQFNSVQWEVGKVGLEYC